MTTLPPEHPVPAVRASHHYRAVAESFGVDAERYDRTRPPYPAALVDRIIAVSPGPDVLDVGCGTGIEARQFQAAGCRVLGVDPDARMADFARRSGIEAEVATFETWDASGRDFDAVIAGTAWHWVDPVAGAAKAGQVLRIGGLLAPFHHVFHAPPALAGAQAEAYRRVAPDAPVTVTSQLTRSTLAAYEPLFARITDGIRTAGSFGEPERWQFEWECTYSRDQWLDQLPTLGSFTQLAPDQLAAMAAHVGATIDAMGGSFTMSYTTVAVAAARAR